MDHPVDVPSGEMTPRCVSQYNAADPRQSQSSDDPEASSSLLFDPL